MPGADDRSDSDRTLPPDVADAARDPANAFGKYVRLGEIGKGGMGAVCLAWDRELSRPVALKVPKTLDADDLARFRREAQVAAGLSHPNIAAVYEVGEAHRGLYLAMQLIDGESAGKLSSEQGGALALPRAVAIVRDAARAVAFAHEQGILHRDLKPDNVMIDARGQTYVMDFGMAPTQSRTWSSPGR